MTLRGFAGFIALLPFLVAVLYLSAMYASERQAVNDANLAAFNSLRRQEIDGVISGSLRSVLEYYSSKKELPCDERVLLAANRIGGPVPLDLETGSAETWSSFIKDFYAREGVEVELYVFGRKGGVEVKVPIDLPVPLPERKVVTSAAISVLTCGAATGGEIEVASGGISALRDVLGVSSGVLYTVKNKGSGDYWEVRLHDGFK